MAQVSLWPADDARLSRERLRYSTSVQNAATRSWSRSSIRSGDPVTRKDRTPSRIVKRSLKIAGHDSSVSLEDAFWSALREIATAQNIGVSEFVSRIANDRQHKNLSSAIRVFVLGYYRQGGSSPPTSGASGPRKRAGSLN